MNSSLRDAIDKHRDWLILQDEFAQWDQGCQWVTEQIVGWVHAEQHLRPTTLGDSWLNRCSLRVWDVWAYHWNEAALIALDRRINGNAVVEKLRQGLRPGIAGPVAMGGDPLKDAVCVEAFLCGVEPAYEYVRNTYREAFYGEKNRLGLSAGDYFYERVWDLIDSTEVQPTKISQFRGFSSLKTYLRILVRHRLVDCIRKESSQRQVEVQSFHANKRQLVYNYPLHLELDEFGSQVVNAIRTLSESEQKLLLLKYCQGYSNKIAAQAIGRSEGYTSRLHRQAVGKLRLTLKEWSPDRTLDEDFEFSLYAGTLLRGITLALKHVYMRGDSKTTMGQVTSVNQKRRSLSTETQAVFLNPPSAIERENMDCSPSFIQNTAKLIAISETPEITFAALKASAVNCPGSLLIDARGADHNIIFDWLSRFDCLQSEQYEQPTDSPVEVQKVFFVDLSFDLSLFAPLIDRPDVDWFATAEAHEHLTWFYANEISHIWNTIVGTNPIEGLERDVGPDVVSIIDLHSGPEDAAWRKRLLEMEADSE